MFWQQAIDTFAKAEITAFNSVYKMDDPPYTKFNGNSSKFLFAVGIVGTNLADPKRYFEIRLSALTYSYTKPISNNKTYPLEPCSFERWADINNIA